MSAAKEAFEVFTVRPSAKTGGRDYWLKIGVAFAHEKSPGGGFNVILNAMPLDGKLVLRPPKNDGAAAVTAPVVAED